MVQVQLENRDGDWSTEQVVERKGRYIRSTVLHKTFPLTAPVQPLLR
jgi:hypothetical protein